MRVKGVKVIHTAKNLFCYVVSICNLVQEFNGLVSIKGPAKVGPFTLSNSAAHSAPIFLHFLFFVLQTARINSTLPLLNE
jgi:hypothetical protein